MARNYTKFVMPMQLASLPKPQTPEFSEFSDEDVTLATRCQQF